MFSFHKNRNRTITFFLHTVCLRILPPSLEVPCKYSLKSHIDNCLESLNISPFTDGFPNSFTLRILRKTWVPYLGQEDADVAVPSLPCHKSRRTMEEDLSQRAMIKSHWVLTRNIHSMDWFGGKMKRETLTFHGRIHGFL